MIEAAAGDEKHLAALQALKTQYESECIGIERRLINGSRAVVAQDTRDWPSRQEQLQAYMKAFEEPLSEALQRNTWYQRQIDAFSLTHEGVK